MPANYTDNSLLFTASQYQPYEEPTNRFLNFAAGIGVTGGALLAASRIDHSDGGNYLDKVRRISRSVGYNSPLALFNTFRVSEALSPFVTAGAKNFPRSTSDPDLFRYVMGSELTRNNETKLWLQTQYGKEVAALEKKTVTNLFDLTAGQYSLAFEAVEGQAVGSLYYESDSMGRHLISNEAQMIQRASFESTTGSYGTRVPVSNPFAFAYAQASGFADESGSDPRRAFENVLSSFEVVEGPSGVPERVQQKAAWLPIKAVSRDASLTYGRSIFAFGLDRFNRLLQTATEQVPILNRASKRMNDAFGMGLTIRPGKATDMFMRFGIKATKLGAVGVGLNEADYWRREGGPLGHIGFSAATSFGLSYAVQKLYPKMDPKKSRLIGMGAFAAQMVLPAFSEGIGPGMYTMFKNTHIASSALGEMTFMNSYRRTVEGLLPGASDWKTGAFFGLGVALASGVGSKPISSWVYDNLQASTKIGLGIDPSIAADPSTNIVRGLRYYQKAAVSAMFSDFNLPAEFADLKIKNQPFLSERATEVFGTSARLREALTGDEIVTLDELRRSQTNLARTKMENLALKVAERIGGSQGVSAMRDELAHRFEQGLAVKKHASSGLANPMNQSFLYDLERIETKYYGDDSIWGSIRKTAERARSSFVHSFFGATKEGETFTKAANVLNYKTKFGRFGSLFLGGFLVQQFATGGLLGSMKGPSELSDIYSGRELVPVRKGRWWEGGGSSFEGKGISYYRPHDYVNYMSRATDNTRYKVNRSPIQNWFLENFTYQLERENYFDRPYPISGAAFQNTPIIGGLLAATVGRLIKPAKLMHVNEYMKVNQDGEVEFAHRNEYKGPSGRLGGLSPGTPMSPLSGSSVLGEMHYQFRELEGLTGWASNMYTKAVTGEETFGIQRPVLESAAKMFSAREDFWKKQLGGGFFTTEPIRRFLPRERSMIDHYNPIINSMPSWMPDRFKFGDPYRNVEYGEVRLPGKGYESIRPELKGVGAESYPDIFKYAILGDVAPHSREFILLREKMYNQRSQGELSGPAARYMDKIDSMVNEKLSHHTTRQIDPDAYDLGVVGDISRGGFGAAKTILRKGLAPAEYLVPMGFRPSQKLLSDPSYQSLNAIDQYEYERLYGTTHSFWDKPIRDWFRPAFYSAANIMGYEGVPGYRKEANDVNEYFDKLEFLQQMQVAQKAEMTGDSNLRRQALYKASKTAYGVNPQAHAMGIYEALPEGEKAFFDSFSMASEADRERILEMVPEDNRHLYLSLWDRFDRRDPTLYPGSKHQINEEYLTRRLYLLQEYFAERPMPGTDWIGWHEDVEMDDVKIRYANQEAIDLGDLDMYQQRARLQARMPYLDDSLDYLGGSTIGGDGIDSLLRTAGRKSLNTTPFNGTMSVNKFGSSTYGNFHYNDDRSDLIYELMRSSDGF